MKLLKPDRETLHEVPGVPGLVRKPVNIDGAALGFTKLRSLRLYQFEAGSVIQGHAEETGTREYNLALGARRASAVQEYLIAQGVASDRIRTLSFGKERPREVCSDEACYAQNRRAVTVVSATGAGS